MLFDSHVETLLATTVSLVNRLTPGLDGGHPVDVPEDERALRAAVRDAVNAQGYDVTLRGVRAKDAALIATTVAEARRVIEDIDAGDLALAAKRTNVLLRRTGARPQLDTHGPGVWNLHFHGPDDSFGVGWSAGIAAGLAMALGTADAGRLGVCAADACDRVHLDVSRNGGRRFCSPRCQSRTKAAAHRARHGG
ncbi:MAG TPA: CGNR zinc finger domain-containing protein [Nocardioides sp.]|jgi:predicted RNA-binding Zn ribbon-like protein|nr:CGNR zinc finger domain-containing protein [Nocardioides sp.]